jgi:hypothetical protein
MKTHSFSKNFLVNQERIWQEREFYTTAVVLGLDIGLEGWACLEKTDNKSGSLG